jgi:NAD(P)-dependent dehydrogenase (short-subunit alcohol dehydrogenase family)
MNTVSRRFENQVAVVTGAGRGLGRAHALALADLGASVVVNDVTAAAEDVAREIRERGGESVACVSTVATAEGGASIVEAAVEAFGRIDVVINNAGFARNGPFGEMSIDDFDAVLDVHLRGAFFVTQPAWREMQRQGYGRIVMTGSGSGTFGRRSGANYCSAKAALVGLTKALAAEGEQYGIRTNCVLPVAATEFVVDSPLPPSDMALLEGALGDVAGRKEPERVTSLAVHLASRACTANGEIYSACLGRYARGFFGITAGWVSPGEEIPSVEEIEANLPSIEAFEGLLAPTSVFAEMADAARAVTERSRDFAPSSRIGR